MRLSRLLVLTDLDHDRINILRAYRSYWHLVNPAFSKPYVAGAFAAHPDIAGDLVQLFEARFSPEADVDAETALRASLFARLDAVASLDEDRILRGFLGLIDATVRTSAYLGTGVLAFKLLSRSCTSGSRAEAVVRDLRVRSRCRRRPSQGRLGRTRRHPVVDPPRGLSHGSAGADEGPDDEERRHCPDRCKRRFRRSDTSPIRRQGRAPTRCKKAYRTFIGALLDVTDNLDGGRVVHPAGVRVLDGEDPYFVVAADRGTATFSDTANDIAAERGFWLDDAFASGGSSGYDHKALGITARGAWESVRRHFTELDVDVQTDPVTVVGVGDMSGDVFGNGMLLSRSIKLVAAFDHRDIFIDPDPDPETSFVERERIARLGRSSWDDYDRELISPGGGVFPRSLKRIELTEADAGGS